jgi:Dyp-type peroxidase family
MGAPQLDDVQGLILRSYGMPVLRVFVLAVEHVQGARQFLASLVDGRRDVPQLATATDWSTPPGYCVNVGITHAGLRALELPQDSLASFPQEFMEGAVARAARVGDSGGSAPEHWMGGLAGARVHTLLFLFAQSEEILTRISAQLGELYAGALSDVSVHDGAVLPGKLSHFGYRDGFAQPSIENGLAAPLPDVLPRAPTGEFLLGYPSQFTDFQYPVPVPSELGVNGSFLAFRILSQNCDAFERFLAESGAQTGLDPELIAAKICGRWRNGVPISLSPDRPDAGVPLENYNSFDYLPSSAVPEAADDRRGYRCPIGSHIRRMNPRNSTVAGGNGLKRRIIRRGLPYGPAYDPAHPNDGIDRGLLGLFIGVSIKDQFEFLMSDWANKGTFAPGLGGTPDPFMGDNSEPGSKFLVPTPGRKPFELTLERFVTTLGGAYCFLPSATALRYISAVSASG